MDNDTAHKDGTTALALIGGNVTYSVPSSKHRTKQLALVNWVAKGTITGFNVKIVGYLVLKRHFNISGINNHQMTNVPITTVARVANSNEGQVICIFLKAA